MAVSFRAAALAAVASSLCCAAAAQAPRPLSLAEALQKASHAHPRLFIADRDIAIAEARRLQAGVRPNPQLSLEIDNAFGSGGYRWLRAAEATLQLSQVFELGGKRDARVAVAAAEHDAARHQLAAARLELLAETTTAFVAVAGAQRRALVLDRQLAALDRLTPLLRQRVEAGASSEADAARAQVAIDLARIDRDRARTAAAGARRDLASFMGLAQPDFTVVAGDLDRLARPPGFAAVLAAIDGNPQLTRWTAIRAQRDAEILAARLKPTPDLQLGVGLRHYRDSGSVAARLGVSVPIPVWDRNAGGVAEARETAAKAAGERDQARLALTATAGRAVDAMAGALQELDTLRRAVLPNARKALAAVEASYAQGRLPLLDLLESYRTLAEAELREVEALAAYHTAVATIEGLTGGLSTPSGRSAP
ncbi:MAG: TolC family protein [Rhodospirillales bacterium]|nr:MAG: TolC family protein [Rhodospirillales bacterium]